MYNTEVGICGKKITFYTNGFKMEGNTERLTRVSPLNVFLVSMQIKPCGI